MLTSAFILALGPSFAAGQTSTKMRSSLKLGIEREVNQLIKAYFNRI